MKKVRICQTSVPYLGVIVSEGRLEMDRKKINAVLEWPYPSSVKEVQQFLGFCNYYRQYIPRFSDRAQALYGATEKGKTWSLTTKYKDAWDNIKEAFRAADFLGIPNPDEPYRLEPDGSGYANRGVLSQKNKKWTMATYCIPIQRNVTGRKEL